ncbi:MAG: acylphosphatase [Pygmaiobacter sp.]
MEKRVNYHCKGKRQRWCAPYGVLEPCAAPMPFWKGRVLILKILRYALLLSGSVQGVGLRWRAKQVAERLGVTGWAENMEDGTLALEVQGGESELSELLEVLLCERLYSEPELVMKKELPLQDESYFVIH